MSQPVTPQLIHTMECPIAKVCCCSRESPVLPIPENAFFEQAVFDQDLSQGLLELVRLSLVLNDRALELGKHAEHLKHGLAGRRGCVETLLMQKQVDAERVKFGLVP